MAAQSATHARRQKRAFADDLEVLIDTSSREPAKAPTRYPSATDLLEVPAVERFWRHLDPVRVLHDHLGAMDAVGGLVVDSVKPEGSAS